MQSLAHQDSFITKANKTIFFSQTFPCYVIANGITWATLYICDSQQKQIIKLAKCTLRYSVFGQKSYLGGASFYEIAKCFLINAN